MIISEYHVPMELGTHTLKLTQGAQILAGGIEDGKIFVLVAEDADEKNTSDVEVAIYPAKQDIGMKALKGKYLATVAWWGGDSPAYLFEL